MGHAKQELSWCEEHPGQVWGVEKFTGVASWTSLCWEIYLSCLENWGIFSWYPNHAAVVVVVVLVVSFRGVRNILGRFEV